MFTETKWICAAVLPALPYEMKIYYICTQSLNLTKSSCP